MIFAQQSRTFSAVLFNADVGLLDLAVQILDPEPAPGSVLYGPSALGIEPVPSLPGTYRVTLTAPIAPVDGLPLFVVWTSASFGSIAEELIVSLEPAPVGAGNAPSVSEVASFLRARTRNEHGVEQGTFNDDTRPSAAQVRDMIRVAYADVGAIIGFGTTSLSVSQVARGVIAIGAAMLVELSYFPEQVQSGKSPYDKLKEMYDERLERLVSDARSDNDDNLDARNDATMPAYRVPHHTMTTFDMPL